MRILTYARGPEPRAGLVIDDVIYDAANCSSFLTGESLPSGVTEILAAGEVRVLEDVYRRLIDAKHGRADLPLRCWAAMDEVRVLAPIPRPRKILCLGLNYRDHAEEQGKKVPDVPMVFAKMPTAVIANGEPIVIPKGSVSVDFEGEVAVVIGKRVRRADAGEAEEAIFGYCIMNDVTERDLQAGERFWLQAKGADTFAPMGPWIVSRDEIGDPLDLTLTTRLNSRVMQSSSTKNLIFTPADIIVFITKYATLEPGDIVSTGTPAGVGVFRDPQVFLKDGDSVEIEVDRIGRLVNPVVLEK